MLIEFSVENYRSIREEARLSLVASSAREHEGTNVVTPEMNENVRPTPLLRCAAIYGPNASGKTNLLEALWTMRQKVASLTHIMLSSPKPTAFKFDSDCARRPTVYCVNFLANRIRYQYGFSTTQREVTEEWLYAWPHGRTQLWFTRGREKSGSEYFRFGDKLRGDKEVWRRATRPDALFLSTAVSLNSEQLLPVFNWFKDTLCVMDLDRRHRRVREGWDTDLTVESCRSEGKAEVLEFLGAADLGIDDLRVIDRRMSRTFVRHSDDEDRNQSDDQNVEKRSITISKLRLHHAPRHGESAELELNEESDGTRKMLALAGPWLDALANGKVIVCDELHDNLHPALVRFLVERFHDPTTKANGAQLIFTTHDTSILNQDVFRRDQIWFCERDDNLATFLFPLTDFRPRKGAENLERAYLGGRYGALPLVSALSEQRELRTER